MLELELEGATATLTNLNTRTEKSGKEKTPAADLRIRVNRDADVLAFFSPTLKAMIFESAGPRDLADGLPLRDKHMVYPLKRDELMENATVVIDYGVEQKITLAESRLKDFHLTPMEGGTVAVEFTVQCKPDAHKQVPYLYLLQEQGITLTVIPAPRDELPEMDRKAA